MSNRKSPVSGRHKWGESFKHDDGRYWQRCKKCGLWKIYLMCEAYYSKAGDFFEAKTVREPCD
nr:hypothetical protein [uncultured Pedobacter sp.]